MDNKFISESDSKQNLSLDMFAPISLSGPENEEYNNFFFPKDSGGKGIPKMGDLLGLLQELSEVATNINLLYGVLADTIDLSNNDNLQRGALTGMAWGEPGYQDRVSLNAVPPEAAANYIREKFSNRVALGMSKNDEKFSHFMQFLRKGAVIEYGVQSSKQHIPFIIKPQGKGFDILWLGNSGYSYGNSPLLGAPTTHPRNASLLDANNNGAYEQNELAKYKTPIAKSAYESIMLLNDILTDGAANRVEDVKRSTKMLPLDFNFEQFENFTLPGLNAKILPDGVFKNISKKFTKYSKFFRILVVHAPNFELAHQITEKKLDTSKLNKEFLITFPNISFSIAMHLPENIAHYITQTEKTQKVSYSSLCQWVSLWSTEAFLPTAKKRGSQQTKYVVKASEVAKFAAKRKEAGLFVEPGSGDDNNVFISNRGTLVFCPKNDELTAIENAIAYEQECDTALEAFFDKGFCAKFDSDMFDTVMYASLSPTEIEQLKAQSNLIKSRAGTLLTASWDYRQMVYAGADPKDAKILNIGGVTPDALAIANYLTLPLNECLKQLTGVIRIPTRSGGEKALADEDGVAIVSDAEDSRLSIQDALNNDIVKFYDVLYAKGLVPSFQELVKQASEQLGITKLTDDKNKHEEGIYYSLLTSELTEMTSLRYGTEGKKIRAAFDCVLENCGSFGSLRNTLLRTVDRHAVEEELQLSPLHFEKRDGNATELKKTYKWLGGLIYLLSLQAIKKCDAKQLFAVNDKHGALSAKQISQRIMPYVVLMTTYIPKSDAILKKADAQKEHNTINPEISVEDIKVPGTSPEAKAFPHQISAHKILRNKPRFSALNINAGGGKTIITLADIACTIRECSAISENIRPLVVCPDNLIRNWCEDMVKLTGSNWNMIPINTDIAKRWGYKRLDSILRNAPPNTIVVVSMSYLAMAESYTVVIGGKEVRSSHALEFIKNYGFNYIAIDEAHRLKNTGTKIHQFCKDIANSSVVKYVRLLSGTMIPKDVKDIVGIAAMFSGQIFRTKEEFGAYIDSLAGSNSTALDRKRLGLKQVRERFKENIASINIKRKEWAFLLPSPIESFIPVYLSYDEDTVNWRKGDPDPEECTEDERLISQAHREIYEAVLNEEGERVKSLLKTETEDDDEEFEALTGKYNFQRIDRITMDPESDPFGQEIMQKLRDRGIDTTTYVPRKIKECIKRLDLHYAPNEWTSGEYQSSDMVDYKGETYIARKREGSSKFTSTFPPDKDLQTPTTPNGNWKKEKRGKVLILCQYTDSITSLYDRLPAKYQEMTVKIYKHNSKRQNKSNLNAFVKNDKVQIIICQADRVTEGLNLQVCSRLIRVECPWTPGAIEQSSARLFRPEVKKDGSRREYIYLDWIVTDATLEVVKVGKLYNRTLSNCQYEESDNTDGKNGANLYESIMNVIEKPMRLNKFLLGRGKDKYPMFSDLLGEPVDENGRPVVTVDPMTGKQIKYCNMNTYAEYATIRNAEFEAMRKSGKDQDLIRLITVDAPANFKHIDFVPYDFRQEIPDPYGFDYVQFMDFLEDDENKAFLKIVKDLVSTHGLIEKATRGKKSMATRFGGKAIGAFNGMKAHFEGGYGVITSLYVKYDPKVPDAIPVMKVTITNKGIVNTVDANAVYVIPGKLNAAAEAIFNGSRPIFEDEKGGRNAIIIDGEAVEKGKRGKNQVTLDEDYDDLPPAILDDYDEEDEDTVVAPPVTTEPVIPTVTITPVVYDRFVGIVVEGEAIDDIREALSGVGVKFEYKNSYASINIFDRNELKAVVGYVRNNGFVLSDLCAKSIMSILQSSFTRESAAFNIETAPVRELASFYTRNHTMSKGKDLKMYPVISHGRLDLQIDLKTNVNFAPFIGKKIEGMKHGTKMFVKQRDNGMFLALAENKKQLFVIIGTIVKSKKLNISNIKTLKADFDALKTHVAE